jgi:S-(hydroxymethyl)glutathione dehydrogenase/alcohol dehydrogenase
MNRSTEAAVLYATNEPLRLVELDIPAPGKGQVLVDVHYSGICGSQLNEIRGARGPDRYLPHTLGHEGSGIVVETGEGVTKVRPGDHVVLTWLKAAGLDAPGPIYTAGGARINSGPISTFLRSAVVAENRVVKISSDVDLKRAALLGCAVPTGAGLVLHSAAVQTGQSVAIWGAGGIGLSAILAAAMVKANPLIAVDVVPGKLKNATTVGATHVIDAAKTDAVAELMRITGGC